MIFEIAGHTFDRLCYIDMAVGSILTLTVLGLLFASQKPKDPNKRHGKNNL